MSGIPLVQDNEKDSINTSIIAIKRALERINQLLGLSDGGGSDPDLSGLATKQELQDAVNSLQPVDEVTLNNMQSVTSNAVAQAIQGGGWQTLVSNQTGGTFTIQDSATEVLINISNSTGSVVGTFYCLMASLIQRTSCSIPCNNDDRSMWKITNNGKTFTYSGGDYNIVTVYYK